jgi:hypothetical protein
VVWYCLSAAGNVTSVEPLLRLHPRHTAAVADWLRRYRFTPSEVDGEPVSVCKVLRIKFKH